jgi:hypothetical protein
MSTITFDTLKFARRLKEAGVSEKHAEAEADALAEVFELQSRDLATKGDLALLHKDMDALRKDIDAKFESELAPLRSDMRLLKWMLALVVITTVVPALKSLLT